MLPTTNGINTNNNNNSLGIKTVIFL